MSSRASSPLGNGMGCVTGLVLLAVALLHIVAPRAFRWLPSLPFAWTLLFVAVVLVMAGAAVRRKVGIERALAPLLVMPAAVAPAVSSWAETFAHEIVVTDSHNARHAGETLLAIAPVGAVAATVAAWLGGWAISEALARHAARTVTALRAAAWSALVAGAALVAVTATWAGRPPVGANGWSKSLPIVAHLPALEEPKCEGCVDMREDWVGERLVRREWDRGQCSLSQVAGPPAGVKPARMSHGCGWLSLCEALVVREDAAHGLWIVERDPDVAREAPPRTHGRGAIAIGAEKVPNVGQVHARDLNLALRPPDVLVALAASGLVLALALLCLPWPRSPLLEDESLCRDATVSTDGELYLVGDARPLALPSPVRPGPVVAILATRAESFRENAAPTVERVVPGTLAELRLAPRLRRHAWALTVVVIASAPLGGALIALR